MTKDIKISVIIPIYNAEDFLGKCLESILSQRNINFEVICVDDGSSDHSVDIIKRYVADNENIVIVESNENHGQAYARNIGMNIAKGEYIYFMDSDDWLSMDDALVSMYKAVDGEDIDLLVFNAGYEYEVPRKHQCCADLHFKGLSEDVIYSGQHFVCECLKHHSFRPVVWQQFWNRKFLKEKLLSFNERTHPYEDALFSFEGMLQCRRIKYISNEYYTYLWRETSSSHVKYHMQYLRAACICYCESIKFLQYYDISSELSQYVSRYLNTFKHLIKNNLVDIVKLKTKIKDIEGLREFEKIVLQQIMNEQFSYIGSPLGYDKYVQLSKADNVIIYGLGDVGKNIYAMMRTYDINNVLLAVTEVKDDCSEYEGKKVWALKDLVELNDNSIVVISVGSNLANELANYAVDLGFKKIMYLDVCI